MKAPIRLNTPAGVVLADRKPRGIRRMLKAAGSFLLGASLLAGTAAGANAGPMLNGKTRVALPQGEHSDVGRPKPRAKNPLLAGVGYILRLDQWAPYFVATSGALNNQNLFSLIPGSSYTPSGGAALTINNWHTTMTAAGIFNNPDMFNVLFMSLSVRGDTFVGDLNRFLSDSLVTLFIGNQVSYAASHAYRIPAGGGGYGASSGIVSVGFPQEMNQYAMETSEVNGTPTTDPSGTGEIFPGSGIPGQLGELITQQQKIQVNIDPTKVVDANANATYTCSASGTGITAFVVLRGQYDRTVQG